MTARLPDDARCAPARDAARTDAPALDRGRRSCIGARGPPRNAFTYPAFCLRAAAVAASRALARARHRAATARGLVSFHDRDHGPRDGTLARRRGSARCSRAKACAPTARSCCYAFPRMLGYVFNPVSFWVCHDRDGARARRARARSTTRSARRHHYLLAHDDGRPLATGETLTARKVFHVSPFCEVRGRLRVPLPLRPRPLARAHRLLRRRRRRAPLLETHVSGRARTAAGARRARRCSGATAGSRSASSRASTGRR